MIYDQLLKPVLFKTDPEKAHEMAISLAKQTQNSQFLRLLAETTYSESNSGLSKKIFGLDFPNPIGLAAGFDKNGTVAPAMQILGFGFVEVGSITAKASKGNPKPRAFRLPEDRSLINRMGLNNDGADIICKRLSALDLSIPVGVNIAKTNDASIHGEAALQDYLYSYTKALDVADYITVNISCPNTGEGKTFEDPTALKDLLQTLQPGNNNVPTLVKLTVDIEKADLEKLISICEENSVAGYVATNTSSLRKNLVTDPIVLRQIGSGGLSGKAIRQKSTQIIKWIREIAGAGKPIIGVGGIDSANSAIEKLDAGADLIQLYSGLIYEGPGLVKSIKKALKRRNPQVSESP